MKSFEEICGEVAIIRLAQSKNISREEAEQEIQQIIDQTWASHDPVSATTRRRIFRGQKPSPALFVGRLAAQAREKSNTPDS